MAGAPQTRPFTPLLDLQVPLPERKRGLANQLPGFLIGFAGAILFLAVFRNDQRTPPYVALFIPVILFVVVLLHELGHLGAGKLVGFHFSVIQIGWFFLGFEHGRLKLQIRRDLPFRGYAGIRIDHLCRVRRRLIVFVAGGPVATIASLIMVVVIVNVFDLHESRAAVPSQIFVLLSMLIAFASLVPRAGRTNCTDGARLASLINSRKKARRWICLAALANKYSHGTRIRNWNGTWIKAAVSVHDGTADELYACWLAQAWASDRKQSDEASAYLERCLELSDLAGPSMRDFLVLEAAIFQAWWRNDADKATQWLAQIRRQKMLPRLFQLRAALAVECAKKNFDAANSLWEEGRFIIDKLPPSDVRNLMSTSWSEWRDEIRKRQTSEVPSTTPLTAN